MHARGVGRNVLKMVRNYNSGGEGVPQVFRSRQIGSKPFKYKTVVFGLISVLTC